MRADSFPKVRLFFVRSSLRNLSGWPSTSEGRATQPVSNTVSSNDVIRQLERCAARASEAHIPLVVIVYGSPYLLERLETVAALSDALIVAYQDDYRTIEQVAEALTGAGAAGGVLPVSSGVFPRWNGSPLDGTTASELFSR